MKRGSVLIAFETKDYYATATFKEIPVPIHTSVFNGMFEDIMRSEFNRYLEIDEIVRFEIFFIPISITDDGFEDLTHEELERLVNELVVPINVRLCDVYPTREFYDAFDIAIIEY